MGKEALGTWAEDQENGLGSDAEQQFGSAHEKKSSTGKRPTEK